jgi:RNA polymerase sigma-70 factor (ECF subfamily)
LKLVAPGEAAPALLTADAIFRAYSGYVAAVALRLLGRDEDVDDVVQEVFVVSLKGLDKLRDAAAIKGWLATVAVRVSRRKLRYRKLWAAIGLDEPGSGVQNFVAPGASPEDRAMLSRIYAALEELPVDERIAWTLRHVEGEQLEDVARLSGCSLATAKRRIAAAHEKLEGLVSDD